MAILSGIGIENFRVFKEMTYFEFAPLTILTGANNSGKSSVLKALLLLNANAKNDNLLKELDFTLDSDIHHLGDFNTSLNNTSDKKEMSFKLFFSLNDKEFFYELIDSIYLNLNYIQEKLEKNSLAIKVIENTENITSPYEFIEKIAQLVEKDKNWDVKNNMMRQIFKIETINNSINFINKPNVIAFFKKEKINAELLDNFIVEMLNNIFTAIVRDKDNWSISDDVDRFFKYSKSLGKLLENKSIPNKNKYDYLIKCITLAEKKHEKGFFIDNWLDNNVKLALHFFVKLTTNNRILGFENSGNDSMRTISFITKLINLTYIPAVRATQERIYGYQGRTDINRLLARYVRNNIDQKRKDFVEKWVGKNGFYFADEIQFIQIGTYGIAVKVFKNGKELELADLGFGITQLLPVLLQIALNDTDYILLEEPENSLHPNLQSKLADMLIDAQKTFGVRFIVETHSEYLIRKLSYLTAKGVIDSDYTSIYYFYEPERVPKGKNQVEKITIQADGSLDNNFGSGFFDEADNLAIDIFNLKIA